MEIRLKEDILREASKCHGLILVHDELPSGEIVPSVLCADVVQTTREVFEQFRGGNGNAMNAKDTSTSTTNSNNTTNTNTTPNNMNNNPTTHHFPFHQEVVYTRIPISPEQRPEDKYLDEYVHIVRRADIHDALVFNCGMGVGRTTFGMVAALLLRRAKLLSLGEPDPFPITTRTASTSTHPPSAHPTHPTHPINTHTNTPTPTDPDPLKKATLRLVYVLERGLQSKMSPHSAIEWALARSASLIDRLMKAILGEYQVVVALGSVLEEGGRDKRLLDLVIDRCDALVNLREEILMNRVRHTVNNDERSLEKALGFLERYFFLLAFCSYVNGAIHTDFAQPFNQWIQHRPEVWNMLEHLRRKGPQLFLFRPVEDLSAFHRVSVAGGPSELEDVVIRNRNGSVLVGQTILKVDLWSSELVSRSKIEGAPNFRQIPALPLFAVAQPTMAGTRNVLSEMEKAIPGIQKVVWINLREEPIVYVNGSPYVLRDLYFTLRNIKSYSGITQGRLELLEMRLKEDVVKEVGVYEGRVLLHEESRENVVVPMWTAVHPDNVHSLKEIVARVREEGGHGLEVELYRVPVTAEAAPEASDFDQLVGILCRSGLEGTGFVMNCQVGLGRSTTGSVIASLIIRWLKRDRSVPKQSESGVGTHVNYQIIHALLRVILNGLECKAVVDAAIDACGSLLNLRDHIEEWRVQAEAEMDDQKKSRKYKRGLEALRRYFLLVAFQAYLESHDPESLDALETFTAWVQARPEFETMLSEMKHVGPAALLPVDQLKPGDGVALTSEVQKVVHSRRGAVLAQQMILKFDHFPGCQKVSLADRLEGAPNFRKVDMDLLVSACHVKRAERVCDVFGVAMPTKAAIKTVLQCVDAGPEGKKQLLWTMLREEPVLYVNGNPYVLRLFQDPIKNLETTGIERDRVESMEQRMKEDAIAELSLYGGRLLLHEEESTPSGFVIVPTWETVTAADIQTPKEVFGSIVNEGFKVHYSRIPITDEQAPLPAVFDLLIGQVLRTDRSTNVLFNCQMGRGRTTTGMVVACIMQLIRSGLKSELSSPLLAAEASLADLTIDPEEHERRRFLRGEYKIILLLLRVLPFGRASKHMVDKAVDACQHIQDIRGAIYDYKLRVEALEFGSKKYEALKQVGINYLIRYFYLIIFANYLLEKIDKFGLSHLDKWTDDIHFPSFSAWLKDRREIRTILDDNQDFS